MNLISIRSLTALAALAAPAAAQGMIPYLPKKTMMAMSAPDLAASMAEMRQMPIAKMWAEDEVQAFVSDVMEMAMEQIDEGMDQMRAMHDAGMMPVSPDMLMKLRLQGFTLAVTEFELKMGDFEPFPNVRRWMDSLRGIDSHDDVHVVLAELGDISTEPPPMEAIKNANITALRTLKARLAELSS